ncbi:helix-turn-helix transcriptional regulator [Streptomyces lonegramiae]|uniref:LuxR C-terminal-related transcriptional regulator n=2 Tax=Streptomyces TaxID=1883 RepID=A0ABU2XGD6_9ACTN|nr:LuxR C-terminal-related transcriptional regulator [Streptomyces sp. DSM 41529]MDT0545000.1 LuxR C-terminal-related transcriptional regulator [Streptomyces sp. DSM 41529]
MAALPHTARVTPDHPRVHEGRGRYATGMATLTSDLRVLAGDDDFFRHFGGSSAELCGRELFELLRPSALSVLREHFSRLHDGRRTRFTERVVGCRSDGQVFSGDLTGTAIEGPSRQASSIVVLVRPDDEPATEEVSTLRGLLLSPIEARILEGVATGASTVQLASKLYLSRQGVEYHVSSMLRKLKAPNRAALVSRAYAAGILTVGTWPAQVLPEYIK